MTPGGLALAKPAAGGSRRAGFSDSFSVAPVGRRRLGCEDCQAVGSGMRPSPVRKAKAGGLTCDSPITYLSCRDAPDLATVTFLLEIVKNSELAQ